MVIGALLGSAGLASSGIWGYNRENYMYDREMRQRQEFAVANMRLRQADLWREDVRDLLGLTEKRMDSYMIVNALQLGFIIVLFTEGRLEPGTPEWLLWLYMLSLVGAFMFLLMAIWFAMHASVVAQGSSVRLLTQLVRPAVPSWEQVEAMRTYGFSWEGMPARHMLRVPVLQTVSEGTDAGAGGQSGNHDAKPGTTASDPWGLERRGDDIYELQRRPLPASRHLRLVREAMRHAQAFDAFARVCMTLGTILECYALLYYVIGYALVQDGSPWAAWVASTVFLGMSSSILQLDVAMTCGEHRLAQGFLISGPVLAAVAAAEWSTYKASSKLVAWTLLPGAYFSHVAFLLIFVRLCHVERQCGGLLLPMSFRSILYLDVFGWLTHKRGGGETSGSAEFTGVQSHQLDADGDESECSAEGADRVPRARNSRMSLTSTPDHPRDTRHVVRQAQHPDRLKVVYRQNFPRYFHRTPIALRPEDVDTSLLRPGDSTGSQEALEEASRHLLEELEEFDSKDHPLHGVGPVGVIPVASERTFEPASFADRALPLRAGQEELLSAREAYHSGELPWFVFRGAVLVLATFWAIGGGWVCCMNYGIPDIPDLVLPESVHITGETKTLNSGSLPLSHRIASLSSFLPPGEQILTQWPHDRFQPWGLSCDSTGHHFAISDEFQLYFASLEEVLPAQPGFRTGGNASQTQWRLGRVRSTARCPALEGQAMRDVGLSCSAEAGQAPARCRALVLHEHGTRLAECGSMSIEPAARALLTEQDMIDVPGAAPEGRAPQAGAVGSGPSSAWSSADAGGDVWEISANWLRSPSTGQPEEVVSIAIDASCNRSAADQRPGRSLAQPGAADQGCLVVGTSHGRAVRMRRHFQESRKLVPSGALWNLLGAPPAAEDQVLATSVMHTLAGGYLLKLREERRSVQVIDMASGSVLGEWRLPELRGRAWSALAAGGRYVYLTSQSANGDDADLWRFPLPFDINA